MRQYEFCHKVGSNQPTLHSKRTDMDVDSFCRYQKNLTYTFVWKNRHPAGETLETNESRSVLEYIQQELRKKDYLGWVKIKTKIVLESCLLYSSVSFWEVSFRLNILEVMESNTICHFVADLSCACYKFVLSLLDYLVHDIRFHSYVLQYPIYCKKIFWTYLHVRQVVKYSS